MKLFTAAQIRAWDQYTIEHEPVSSIDLMERAAQQCVAWLLQQSFSGNYRIFCGKGNNGGDGLAIARLLLNEQKEVTVFIIENKKQGTPDFKTNLQRLQQVHKNAIVNIESEEQFTVLTSEDIIIDCLFGSGLNKPLSGIYASLVNYINNKAQRIISIDLPSGLFADQSSTDQPIIRASHVLTFQVEKQGLLLAENAPYIGEVHVMDIGLDKTFEEIEPSNRELIDEVLIRHIYKPRSSFAHKGTFGHALLIAGSYGKMGACALASGSCLRSGVGLLTCYIPKCGYEIIQSTVPEAMCLTDREEKRLVHLPVELDRYSSIGIGPGIGTEEATQRLLGLLLKQYHQPMVIDADSLNCLSLNKEWLLRLPPQSIITPHPKEFERLFGKTANEFDRIALANKKAKELNIVIVLKGHHTFIATSGGLGYFNTTGNAGMATGGSGDVLTGILTGLLAQGYSPVRAAILGVYIHGLAGDLAAAVSSMESLVASDITNYLGKAFSAIHQR